MAAVKIGVSRQIIIPKKIYDELKLSSGDYLEVEVEDDRLVLTPKELVEKRLAEALSDVKKGRVRGPFNSARQMTRSLRAKRPSSGGRTKKTK
jgi:AbrB family looped-hinge helix DNA binding protein